MVLPNETRAAFPQNALNPSFFHLVHPGNPYPVMRDVADMVCYGKEKASWMVRLRTGRGAWQWFKVQAHNLLDGPEAAILLHLREL